MNISDQDVNGQELVSRTEVADSPFTIIGTEGKYFAVMGAYKVTEQYDTEEEVLEKLGFSWDRVTQIFAIMLNQQEDILKFVKDQEG